MGLNTIANRTYNDLTQYPVFPWIIKDYSSSRINLNNLGTYRDLSKPIGALNESRLENIVERYECFTDPVIPRFHYGSHYSSVGTVLYYLIRMEPFTNCAIQLQSGTFDLPDRLFHSLETTWQNIMMSNSDVKELTPEFFYTPEFLKNTNRLDLGLKQNDERLDDVVLPPWANGSAEEFIRINREALESEYVSDHLNEWIDLIFGYKQTGIEAEKAYNIFYYLTYEGAVDIDQIQDPTLKRSIETQISNFGQTPTQLFKRPHPKRFARRIFQRPIMWRDNAFLSCMTMAVRVEIPDFPENDISINFIQALRPTNTGEQIIPSILGFEMNNQQMQTTPALSTQDRLMIINGDRNLFNYMWTKPKPNFIFQTPIGNPIAPEIDRNNHCFVISNDGQWVFSCGHFDKSIKCSSIYDKLTVKQSVFHHKDIVACLALSEDGKHLVSGSHDSTVNVYAINHNMYFRRGIRTGVETIRSGLGNAIRTTASTIVKVTDTSLVDVNHSNLDNGVFKSMISTTAPLSEQPVHVLYGHEAAVISVDVNADLDTVVSGAKDGNCLIHTLCEGRYVRTIRHPMGHEIDIVRLSVEGHIVIHSIRDGLLLVYTLNGTLLATMDTMDHLSFIIITPDSKYVVCGGARQCVSVRRLCDLFELHCFDTCGSAIRSGCLLSDGKNVMVGLENGTMQCYALDPKVLERDDEENDIGTFQVIDSHGLSIITE
jgi:WD40 repeat protein